jgi:hypothetical protein
VKNKNIKIKNIKSQSTERKHREKREKRKTYGQKKNRTLKYKQNRKTPVWETNRK